LYSKGKRRKIMEQEGIPVAIGVIIGAAIAGAIIFAGLIVAAVLIM
jgi:hypothetical protein